MIERREGRAESAVWRFGLLALLAVFAGALVAGARVSPAMAVAGTCQFSSATYTVTEGDPLNVVVQRSGSPLTQAEIGYSSAGVTAFPGTHFSPFLQTTTFAGSSVTVQFTITTVGDADPNADRTFTLALTAGGDVNIPDCAPSGVTTATVTIADDDGPQPPSITNVTPESGNIAGGTLVTITGNHFAEGTNVDCPADISFGGANPTDCGGFTRTNTQITVKAPAHAAGTVSIQLDNGNGVSSTAGTADDFQYFDGPVVHDVSPGTGTAGTTTANVTITGEGFTAGSTVAFGPVAATVTNPGGAPTQLVVTAPSQAIGTVNVRVTESAKTSPDTIDDDFQYVGTLPVVTSLSPSSGPTAGGTVVTITGTNLTGATSVLFGSTAATTFTVTNSTQITATAPGAALAGKVDVKVTTPSGESSVAGTGDDYTYTVAPAITNLNPKKGPAAGGQSVVITGTGLLGVSAVKFGTTNATSFTVDSATQITAVSPAHIAATVDVTVTNASGTSANSAADDYEFVGGPSIDSLDPVGGPPAGGTVVTITGFGFAGATAVKFGTTAATTFTVVNDTKITATSPAHAAGIVDVSVTAPGGTTANTLADDFAYGAAAITSISPNKGPASGGTIVTILGTNFIGATAVKFGNTNATSFIIANATQITAVAPAGTIGDVHITVVTPAGTSAATAADLYTYLAVPVITSISPTKGPIEGGTTVLIYGKDFTGATSVAFGAKAATSFTVLSDTQISAVAPSNTAGTIAIRVTSPKGTSAANAASQYTYKSGENTVYTLEFRWNLRTWAGEDNTDIVKALNGVDDDSDTNDITSQVTAVYYWTGSSWLSYFPGKSNVPGANTLFVLNYGQAYWIAVTAPTTWTVITGP